VWAAPVSACPMILPLAAMATFLIHNLIASRLRSKRLQLRCQPPGDLQLDDFCDTSRIPEGHRHDCQNGIVATIRWMQGGIADE
jgi:hypothetical protein